MKRKVRKMKSRKKRKKNEEEEEDLEIEEEESIYSHGNVVYFHAPVSMKTVSSLIKELNKAVDYLKRLRIDGASIKLYIHSDGGCVYSGLSAMEHVSKCEYDVVTYVDGCVASAGTFILLGGKKRIMNKYSEVLIHQFRSGFFGKYTELQEEMKNNDKLMKMFKDIYTTKTKIPQRILNTILSKEISFGADECLKYGIVDEVT